MSTRLREIQALHSKLAGDRMTEPTEVAVHQVKAALDLDVQREAATRALAQRPGFDLASISEEDFERGVERLKTRQRRMQRILETVLVVGAHYGNPNNAWKKPRLLKAGAVELRDLFRLQPRMVAEPVVETSAEYVAVTVRIQMLDSRGHLVSEQPGHCNTMEKRFKKHDGKGFTWTDAREALHDCHMMAEKRAYVAAILAATASDAFFANGEVMEKALANEAEEQAERMAAGAKGDERQAPDEHVRDLMNQARQRGIATRLEWASLVERTLGRRFIAAGDVDRLRAAIQALPPNGGTA